MANLMGAPGLLSILRDEAAARRLWPAGDSPSAGLVFSLVRDLSYRRASSRAPETTLREWQGTCSGKHYLLANLLEELGLEVRLMMCTNLYTQENSGHFPNPLRAELAAGPIHDVHNS